jgi:uncharacterized iron-regulated membrane protein
VRAALLFVHRWLGLTAGLVLLVSGLTGALLVLAKPLDRALNAHLFRVAPAAPAGFDGIFAELRAAHPGADLIFRLPREPGESLLVYVKGTADMQVHYDPATGRLLGVRGATEGPYNLLFELHSELLSGQTGRPILALAALAYLVMLIAGLALWWPRRKRLREGFRVRWRRPARIVAFDLHRVGGAIAGLLVLVSVTSGAYMAWRPISAAVDAVAGGAPPRPPKVAVPPGSAPAGIDAVLQAADRSMPGGRLSIVQWPADPARPVRVRKQMPDEVHPNGLSSVWIDPYRLVPVAASHWRAPPIGTRLFQWMYPLHAGALGGVLHEALVFTLGLVLAALGGTGVWLWWTGRAASRRRGVAAAVPGDPA